MSRLLLFVVFVCVSGFGFVRAGDYSAVVRNASIDLVEDQYELNAELAYQLSPIAKEALSKGIALTWRVLVKVQEQGILWDFTLYEKELVFKIQNHALLNLYSIQRSEDGTMDMYSSLTSALYSISKIRNLKLFDKAVLENKQNVYLAVKVLFDREALAVPLRPMSYFDSQWDLSSQWTLWQLQN